MRSTAALCMMMTAAVLFSGCDGDELARLDQADAPGRVESQSTPPQRQVPEPGGDAQQTASSSEAESPAARSMLADDRAERPVPADETPVAAGDGRGNSLPPPASAPAPLSRRESAAPSPGSAGTARDSAGAQKMPETAPPVATAVERLSQLSDAFSQVAETIQPTVVQVLSEVHVSGLHQRQGGVQFQQRRVQPDEFFELFGDLFRSEPETRTQPRLRSPQDEYSQYDVPQPVGAGSGWIYDDQGHIVTSRHVVANADLVMVRFFNGEETRAEVVGVDPPTDVAVLKVDARALPQSARRVHLAEQPVKPGDIVFAVGSPFEYAFSVSQGIVSATGRVVGILGPQGYENFIQTDAAINPGNSGGPLTNVRGEVVGMNTAIASQSGAFAGIGFATPVSLITEVAEELLRDGTVSRGYLGAVISDDRRLLRTFGVETGVVVEDVAPDSPAARAGLRSGDVILMLEDQPLQSAADLRRTVAGRDLGDVIRLTFMRDGRRDKLEATLGQLPTQQDPTGRRTKPVQEKPPEDGGDLLLKLGFQQLAPMTQAVAQQTGLPYAAGVLVLDVRRFSVADAAEIRRGHIVTDVMGKSVKTPDELREQLAAHDVEDVRISLRIPAGLRRYVVLSLP